MLYLHSIGEQPIYFYMLSVSGYYNLDLAWVWLLRIERVCRESHHPARGGVWICKCEQGEPPHQPRSSHSRLVSGSEHHWSVREWDHTLNISHRDSEDCADTDEAHDGADNDNGPKRLRHWRCLDTGSSLFSLTAHSQSSPHFQNIKVGLGDLHFFRNTANWLLHHLIANF